MHLNKHKRVRKDLRVNTNVHIGLKGFFTVELIDAKTKEVKRRLEFENLITDAGLNALAATQIGTLCNSYMACGTGAVAPAVTDTILGAEVASRSNSTGGIAGTSGSGPAFAYWFQKTTRNFIESQVNGNLTELGLFTASSGGTMWCRQLFKDGAGAPTVIVKTAAEQLRVTYEIRLYSPADVTVNPLAISGTNYSITTRAIHIDIAFSWGDAGNLSMLSNGFSGNNANSTASIKAIESNVLVSQTAASPAGTLYTPTSVAMAGYVAGNFYQEYTCIWDPGVANPVGGIGGLLLECRYFNVPLSLTVCEFQMAFTPKLPKDNMKRLTLVVRLSWGRYP